MEMGWRARNGEIGDGSMQGKSWFFVLDVGGVFGH